MSPRFLFLGIVVFALLAANGGMKIAILAQEKNAADVVILNAKVWTVDTAHPTAEAVAITGQFIEALGTSAEIRKWIGPKTKTIDAGGHTVLPGFNDAHVHFTSGGSEISGV